MLAKLFLVFLVGYASASHYAWKPNTEYTYRVLGRALSGLPDHDPTMSGILVKAELKIVPKTPEVLTAKLQHSQHCRVQMKFMDSWEEEVPDSECQYKPMAISEEPFEIHLHEGIVQDVVVAKSLKNWEANVIKSVVSQLQLNVNAQHPIDSEINILPHGKHHFGTFKVMEKTVTGEYETTYVLKPESEHMWPILSHHSHDPSHQHILISKSKNFTNHGVLVGYHYGFGEMETSEPNTNSMGRFMNRTSTSNAIIFGDLEDYVIKTSNTSNVVSLSPLYNNHKSGIIASKVCLILKNMQPGKTYSSPSEPIQVGILYQYDNSYGSNHVESSRRPQLVPDEDSPYKREPYQRLNRVHSKKSHGYSLDQSQLELDQPSLEMSHLATGYEGRAVKFSDKVNIVEEAKKLAHEIAQDLQHPNELPKRETVSKFVTLRNLCRLMNKEEMHKVAEGLYSNEHQGPKVEAWKAIRDAIAQTGSGPALLTIRDWIKTNKVDHHEASRLVVRMAVAARHPTVKYLRAFQKLVEESVEHHHHALNDSAVISYANLLHQVCVDKEFSYQEYPFHTYGSFYTAECQTIVKEYIRYLDQHLHKSVAQSDSHQIMVYSVALGKIGHRDIYRSFEKYIKQTPEKRQQIPEQQRVTEFQRFIMVSSLRRFVELYPEAARDLLSSIYFSASEHQELRTVAVYLTAFTEPDASLLTAMAQHTHVGRNDYVNSAIKSTIRKLRDMHYEPAIQAERYLNDEEYGLQYSHNVLHEYTRHNMDTELRHSLRTFAGVDHVIPKGIHSKLQIILGGAHFNLVTYDEVVSSVEELINAFEHQTEHYHQQVHQKQSHLKDEAHSSHKIYETLGMNVAEREQLEGLARLRLGDGVHHFTLDDSTVHNITRVIEHMQQELKAGHKFSHTAWTINHEAVLAAPTEMGLPYSFSAGIAALWSVDGKVHAEAHPHICNGELLKSPESIDASAEVDALVNREVHSSIRFYTPFDHQDYVSGYSKKMQIHLPINAKAQVDTKNNHITCNIKPIQPERDIKMFHVSTVPYNAVHDILSMKPAENSQKYVPLTHEKPRIHDTEFGKKTVGMKFQLHQETDEEHISWNRFLQSVQHKGAVETAMRLLFDDEISYSKTELWYKGSESVNREIKCNLKYMHKHYDDPQGSAPSIQEIVGLPSEQQSRIQHVVEKAAAGIKSVDVVAGDLHIQFAGQQEYNIHAGGACAKSPVDKHSRIIAHIHTEPKHGDQKPWHLALLQTGETPNTNGLDYEYALKMDPRIKAYIKLAMGEKDHLSNVEVDAEFHKTEERVQYLKTLPEHHKCHEQIKEGNRILPECANMTAKANLLNDIAVHIKHNGLSKHAKQVLQKVATLARPCAANEFEFEHHDDQQEGEIQLNFHFSPDLEHAHYTVEGTLATQLKHTCEHIPINRWQRQLFVLHPIFRASTRLAAEAYHIDTYRPICVVDKTRAATFDGKEYDAHLSDGWTVMLHYLPQYANQTGDSDLKYRKHHQIHEHVVLVRHENQGKAVKITLRTPETEQQLAEVELKPTGQSNPKVKVLVDNKEVQCSHQKVQEFHRRAIRVYELPNNEIKVHIGSDYYVIADGHRVKLTTTSSLFHNATRGLCGNLNGMEVDDFMLPSGGISIEPAEHFVHAYTLGSPNQKKQHEMRREHVHLPIPSFERIEELSQHQIDSSESHSCTGHRTLYFRKNNKDCFSVRAYPVCKPGCHHQEETSKKVDLICVDESSASQQWRRKAEAGDYLNFQHRQPNEHIETKIQSHCQQ